MPWLINSAQVDKFRKSQKSLIILDASTHLTQTGRDAKEEFQNKHILGAQFFDINEFADPNSSIPYMLINDETKISEKLGALGIRNDFKIIFYDNSDLHSAARGLWMMEVFGHNPHLLYILDGGLPAWEKYKGKIESGKSSCTPKKYSAKFQPQYVRTLQQIKENLKTSKEQIIDLRTGARFAGAKEVRPAMRSGHIPNSIAFPYTSFFEPNGTFKPREKIRDQLGSVAIDLKAPIIATCGAAITACILFFVLELLGHKQHSVYDGSWAEWGSEKLYPEEKSLDERPVATCVDTDYPDEIEVDEELSRRISEKMQEIGK